MPDTEPVSWRTLIYGTAVMSSDGAQIGTVREVLGDDAADIFHGLRVRLEHGGRDVMVAADDVASLTEDAVRLDLTNSAVEALTDFHEEASYHLASVGWLRKHLGWKQDSKSDEEPG